MRSPFTWVTKPVRSGMCSRRMLSQSQNLPLNSVSHLLRPCQWRGGFLPPFLTCKLTRLCPGPWEERILTPAEAVACPALPACPRFGHRGGILDLQGRREAPGRACSPHTAPSASAGVPGPPPLPLWPRPVRGIAGEARAHREPQGAKVEVFSPQACCGKPPFLGSASTGHGGCGRDPVRGR